MRATVIAAALSLTIVSFSVATDVDAAVRKSTSIPAQGLAPALHMLAKERDFQLLYRSELVRSLNTAGATGDLTTDEALQQLLSGTGLSYRYLDEKTVTVLPLSSGSGSEADALGTDSSRIPPAPQAFNNPQTPDTGTAKKPGFWDRFRLAQNDQSSNKSDSDKQEEKPSQSSGENSESRVIDEVVVTGSNIRGSAPVGSNLIVIDAKEISHTAHATIQDVIHALPQNFRGGANEETRVGGGSSPNTSSASSVNLHGLGGGATLVLVNGRRLAPAGFDASFVDISSVPLSAIDRIEVLADGASAIYGADAVGGVVNIILQKDYESAETRLNGAFTTNGGGRTLQAAQTMGLNWNSGDALLAYEFYERGELAARDRSRTASADLRNQGGDDFRGQFRFSNPGTIVIGASTWAIPEGQDGRSLTAGQLLAGTANRGDAMKTVNLLPQQRRQALVAALNQRVGQRARLFLNTLYSARDALNHGGGAAATLRVPVTNPFYVNPAGGSATLSVRYNFVDDLGPTFADLDIETRSFAGGMEYSMGRDWQARIEGNYGREDILQVNGNRVITAVLNTSLADPNPATAFNPFGDGSFTNPQTLAALRGTQSFESRSDLESAFGMLSGPLLALPGGDLALAVGGEHRRQSFSTSTQTQTSVAAYLTTERARSIDAGFAELRVPVFGAGNSRAGLQRLDLSMAVRYERYSDFGAATTPKFGLSWAPVESFALRGTWGKSFRAPTLADLNEAGNFLTLSSTPDASGVNVPYLQWSGGNADIQEETAVSWSVGVDFTPPQIANFQLGLTYFNIDFDDRIRVPPPGPFLQDPSLAPFVTLNPTLAQRQDVCSRGTFFGVNPADCLNAPIAAIVDLRSQNFANTRQSGVDVTGAYAFDSSLGRFSLGLSAAWLAELAEVRVPNTPEVEVLDTPLNPADLRLRASGGWSRGAWGAHVYVNYIDGYEDNVSVPARRIDSWTTADFQLSFEVPKGAGRVLEGVAIALNVQNLFDAEPPFFNNSGGIGYDPTNAQIIGRLIGAQVRKSW